MRSLPLLALAVVALAAPLLADDEPSVVLLNDGQTLTGRVEVLPTGEVIVQVKTAAGGTLALRLDASAVARIEPAGAKVERLAQAAVHLVDGRELRGEVRAGAAEVVVRGPHGEVAVPREDVARIVPVVADAPRVAVDADLGLTLPLPPGWAADVADGIGERLRVLRRDGAARISVLLRPAPAGRTALDRARAALEHDVSPEARFEPLEGGGFRVEDRIADPACPGWTVRVVGRVELEEGRALWRRALLDGQAERDAKLVEEVDQLLARAAWLPKGRSRDGALFRDPALGVLIEAPPGHRLEAGKDGTVTVTTPADPGARLELRVVDDGDLKAAVLDALDGPPEGEVALADEGRAVARARREGERALAAAAGERRCIVIAARAGSPERLRELGAGVVLLDASAPAASLAAAEHLLPIRSRAAAALAAGDVAGASRDLELLLTEAPDDPDALGLAVAAARARGDRERLIAALDLAWTAGGAPWVAAELGRTLLALAQERAEEAGGHEAALEAIERASEVWPAPEVADATAAMLIAAARSSFERGEATACWARFARARTLTGDRTDLDEAEMELRMKAARAALEKHDANGARREARRGWALGAPADEVEAIYSSAEALDIAAAAARDAERDRLRGQPAGGLVFGVPPTRNADSGRRIRPTAFSSPGQGSRRIRSAFDQRSTGRRVRAPQQSQGSRRVRPPSYGGGQRVRTNGATFN